MRRSLFQSLRRPRRPTRHCPLSRGSVGRGAENHVQTRRERRWPEPRVRDVLSSLEARHVDHSSLGKGKTEEATLEIKRDAQDRKLYG